MLNINIAKNILEKTSEIILGLLICRNGYAHYEYRVFWNCDGSSRESQYVGTRKPTFWFYSIGGYR